jgi:hypothetical protein
MADLKRKPLPAELNEALRGGVIGFPTATGERPRQEVEPSGAGQGAQKEAERQRRAPKTVQVNVAVTEELADLIGEEAIKAGSTRRWLAKLMKDAGYIVPEADLMPLDLRRRKNRPVP